MFLPSTPPEKTTLLAYPCTHTFHLHCLLKNQNSNSNPDPDLPAILSTFNAPTHEEEGEEESGNYDRSIGPKIDHAALLRTVVGEGCPVAEHHMDDGVG